MRTLDTHEVKSPRFLIDAFPDIKMVPMKHGDYFSGELIVVEGKIKSGQYKGFDASWNEMKGNLVEIKIGKDFGIHTEQLERFQDELYRMSCYRKKNPQVQLHAYWLFEDGQNHGIKQFVSLCCKYHVWAHWGVYKIRLIEFLKSLDQPSSYKEFEPYIKRSHEEPTDLARALRVPKGISSELAIDVSSCQTYIEFKNHVGLRKKDKKLTKNGMKLILFLRKLVRFYNQIDCSKMRSEEQIGPGEEP